MRNRELFLGATFYATLLAGGVAAVLAQPFDGRIVNNTTSITNCKPGYTLQDVRIYGQRFEPDVSKYGPLPPIIVPNENLTDTRYVVAELCVRPMNANEHDEDYWKNAQR